MTELQLERRVNGRCVRTRCDSAAADDSDFCPAHREQARTSTRMSMAALRALRRELGLCVDCGVGSPTYRCAPCRTGECRDVSNGADLHTLDRALAI